MREPFISEALENGPDANDTVKRDPSYPDRARIDSDVRAFLRPVSTPWIVFDRDSRVDDFAKSALRIGAVFASSPSFRPEVIKAAQESGRSLEEVVAMPLPGLAPLEPLPKREDAFRDGAVLSPSTSSVLAEGRVFPPASPADSVSVVEPSNVVVATDVVAESAGGADRPSLDPAVGRRSSAKSRRVAAAAMAVVGIIGLVAVGAFALARIGRLHAAPAAAAAKPAPIEAPVALAAPPVETVELDAISVPLANKSEEASKPSPGAKVSPDPKKRFGRLSIRSEARYKNVWFDGKRMLGTGQRSFLVFCGMHTIAVADKTDTKDVEIPCDGEYTVWR